MGRRRLLIVLVGVSLTSPPLCGQQTRAERSHYQETSRDSDVLAFLDTLATRHHEVVRGTLATTTQGRPVPYVIVSRPRIATAHAARRRGRPIVYVNANIHAGEVEGKEAILALLRDLLNHRAPNVLDSVVVIAVPNYNADGNDAVAPQSVNRTEQRGPELVGTRANAQKLNLNRDYVKAEAPETRGFLAMFGRWRPDVYVDLHTTDGSYHGYALTYSPGLNPNGDPYTRDTMLPAIRQRMRARHKYETFDYGNFDSDDYTAALTDTVRRGWYPFEAKPREGTNYVGLRGRIGILSEAYSHDPFERRVAVTRAFVQEILSYAARHPAGVRAASTRGDRPPRVGEPVAIRTAPTSTPYTGDVLAEDLVRTADSTEVTEPGVPPGYRRTGKIRTLRIPVYDRFVSTLDRPAPLGYVLDRTDTAAARLLALHRIAIDTLRRAVRAVTERFVVDSTWTAAEPFEGHRQRSVHGRWTNQTVTLPAGSLLVRATQRDGMLAMYLLEPESEDGLVTWNVFDAALAPGRSFPVGRVTRLLDRP